MSDLQTKCQKLLPLDDGARKAFADRQAKLILCPKWPIQNWYNDEDFCRAYNTACHYKDVFDAQAMEIAVLKAPARPSAQEHKWRKVPETARVLQTNSSKVLAFIKAGLLEAVNIALPGATKPRYRITDEALARFVVARSSRPPRLSV